MGIMQPPGAMEAAAMRASCEKAKPPFLLPKAFPEAPEGTQASGGRQTDVHPDLSPHPPEQVRGASCLRAKTHEIFWPGSAWQGNCRQDSKFR